MRGGDLVNTPALQLAAVTALNERITELTAELRQLSVARKRLVHELHTAGYSHARIGKAVGLSASRVFQILQGEIPKPEPATPRFDRGDVVRVGDETELSVVVLPTYCKPAPEDVPSELPEIGICCVPLALVRTPAAENGTLRWLAVETLERVSVAGNRR